MKILDLEKFASDVVAERERRHFSVEEFASVVGVSENTIRRIERREVKRIQPSIVVKILYWAKTRGMASFGGYDIAAIRPQELL